MKRNRTLGLVAMGALVIMALVGAGTASASQFRAEKYPTPVWGKQAVQQVLKVTTGLVKCSTVELSGSLGTASSSLATTPSFGECKAFGAKATINANSCKFDFNSTNESAPYTGTMDVACSKEGDAIEVTSTVISCQVKIPGQSGLGKVEFELGGLNANRSVTAAMNLSTLKYTEVGSECAAPGTHESGSYTGSSTIHGYTGAEATGPKVGLYIANTQIEAGPALVRAEGFPAMLAGESSATLTTSEGARKCTLGLSGEEATASKEVRLNPTWTGCTSFGVVFTIKNNGCYFVAHVASEVAGTLDVACEKAGSEITFSVPGWTCTTSIPAQSGLGSLGYENTGTGQSRSIVAALAISGLKYTETGSQCSSPGTHTNGKLAGSVMLKGFTVVGGAKGPQQGVWVE